MKMFLIKILFRLLKTPLGREVDTKQMQEWLGNQFPLKTFRDYITTRDLSLLQMLGEGLSREDYLLTLGQRIELGKLLTEAKNAFAKSEKERKRKADENAKHKKG